MIAMIKIGIFLLLGIFCSGELWAGPGKVVVKNAKEQPCVYNSIRGRGRACFEPAKDQKGNVVIVPEEQCKDLLYLIADGHTSWIQVKPDETVTVNVSAKGWKFSGDGAKINRYLNEWTKKMYFWQPNMLTNRIQMMFHQIPASQKSTPDAASFYTPEYMAWVAGLEQEALADLQKANLGNETFIEAQRRRIHNAWLELQMQNYQFAAGNSSFVIPSAAGDFLKNISFDDPAFLQYPGYDDVLRIYFDMADDFSLIPYGASDFLRKRADRIKDQTVKEAYVLGELEGIITNKWLYQTDRVFDSVADVLVSDESRKKFKELEAGYKQMQVTDEAGKPAFRFEFQNTKDESVRLNDFKGKYLLIDIWATWCGPCKYQIPYLIKLEKELQGKDIEFLSVSVDKQADKGKWLQMLKDFGMEENCVISPDAFNYDMFQKYEVKSIPRFMLIDPEGKIVMTKSRRPSDPVLKLQLLELLDRFESEKSMVSGTLRGADGKQLSLMRVGSMSFPLANAVAGDGKFSMNLIVDKPEFLRLSMYPGFYANILVRPGAKIRFSNENGNVFSGDDADVNNFMARTEAKYLMRWPKNSKETVLDQKRSKLLVGVYDDIVRDIESSSLSAEDKRIVKGYFQGELLNRLYGAISISKVFGKSFPKPDVRKGYSDPVLGLEIIPEIDYYPNWIDGMQEFLYGQLEAGKTKIKSNATRLADLAAGITNEATRELYIMEALRLEILRSNLVGAEDRVNSVRGMIGSPANKVLLDQMPSQIRQATERYKGALPGTDLSTFNFKNERGEVVTLGDFKNKYVFIDLWSTGCNPCVGEIPYIKEMEHRFAGKPIAWVSISLDLDEKEWKDFLVKNNMKGIQLLCEKGFKHPFIEQIGLSGIPRFVLLDKEGRVVDYSAMRPSNPVLAEVLGILLKNGK